MSTSLRLFSGELKRLVTYKILPVSLVTSVIWIVLFLFITEEEARHIAPLLIYIDVSMMLVMLIGAMHHLEKQEGTIRSMMVMPVPFTRILYSKIAASMVLAFESAVITSAALYFIHGVTFNYWFLLLFLVVAGVVHAAIGMLLSLISKDFGTMLVYLLGYMVIFTIPTILFSFGIIQEKYEWILMVSPSHSASHLIESAITGEGEMLKILFACVYLLLLSAVLLKYAVFPKFKKNAIGG